MPNKNKTINRIFAMLLCIALLVTTAGYDLNNVFNAATTTETSESSNESKNEDVIIYSESEGNSEDSSSQSEESKEENKSDDLNDPKDSSGNNDSSENEESGDDSEEEFDSDHAVSDIANDLTAPEGYHYHTDGKLYGNRYTFYYNPNNGNTSYEQESKEDTHDYVTVHYYDHSAMYDGLPVYNIYQALPNGHINIDYLVDDLTILTGVYDRLNYNFTEWNTSPDGTGTSYQASQEANNLYSENNVYQTLYAQWEIAQSSVSIIKNNGVFSLEEFEELNGLTDLPKEVSDNISTYTLSDNTQLIVEETEENVVITGNCLTTIKIPDMVSLNENAAFVGYETSSSNFNSLEKTFFLEDKNAKPALSALYLSDLQLQGTVDMHGYNGKSSIYLTWGQMADDNIDKVYKIAQSMDGVNFEYIPDQNLTDLIEGRVYEYTGGVQTFTAPVTGKYFIEAYGANGGIGFQTEETDKPGYGAYTSGYVTLTKGQTIYIYVGEAGKTYNTLGTRRTYGGGGHAPARQYIWSNGEASNWMYHTQGAGGGATYISTTNTDLAAYIPSNFEKLSSTELSSLEKQAVEAAKNHVLMVAAGGSGVGDAGDGADGGALTGADSVVTWYHYGNTSKWTAYGATQTKAGYGDTGRLNGSISDTYYATTTYGSFFYGSNGMSCSGAAGGGWFGGGMCYVTGGSGASSYLGTSLGLYDAKAVAGGNKNNIDKDYYAWNVNGCAVVTICEYWITTNVAENVYSPDLVSPTDPSNLDVSLDESKKGTVTWTESEDFGTDYWYRVDAFSAENHENKIGETEVKYFNITAGVEGYYYVIDNIEDTIAHSANGTFTTDCSVSNLDILDQTEAKYIHIVAIDGNGNYSNTVTKLLNKVTVEIDPNERGTYNGTKDISSFILNSGETYNVGELTADEGQTFLNWKKTTGDGVYDEESKTVTVLYSKMTLMAEYMAELILESTPNYEVNNGAGAVDLTWEQADTLIKKYKLFQSLDGEDFYDAMYTDSESSPTTETFSFDSSKDYYTYVVPYNGTYTLSVAGSKGGNYNTYSGGNGSTISGDFNLKKGDILYIYVGGVGTNGAGSGTYAAGGGATDIRLNGTAISNRILVAAGGGGATIHDNGKSETASSTHNSTLGTGSSGTAGGGSGYYGGNAGTSKTNTQYLIDYVVAKEGPKSNVNQQRAWIGGYYCYYYTYWWSTDGIGACGFNAYTNYMKYDGLDWRICEYHNSNALKYGGPDKYLQTEGHIFNYVRTNVGFIRYSSNGRVTNVGQNTVGTSGWDFYTPYKPDEGFLNDCSSLDINPWTQGHNGAWDAFRTTVVTTGAGAGTSWIDTNYGLSNGLEYGSNAGTGVATIVYDKSAVGELQNNSFDGVSAIDMAAPNIPFNPTLVNTDGTYKWEWKEPDDNGTTYYHKAQSFLAENGTFLRESNITEDLIMTGVKGYRYYFDDQKNGTVTATNSTWHSVNNLVLTEESKTQYLHIAAVDGAGNISETLTLDPIIDTSLITLITTIIWEDEGNAYNTRPELGCGYAFYENGETANMIGGYGGIDVLDGNKQIVETQARIFDNDGLLINYEMAITSPLVIDEDYVAGGYYDIEYGFIEYNNLYHYNVKSSNPDYYYISTYSEDKLTVTNTLYPKYKDITVNVEWQDGNNAMNTRPDSFDVNLTTGATTVQTESVSKDEVTKVIRTTFSEVDGITTGTVQSLIADNPYRTVITKISDTEYKVTNYLSYVVTVNPNGGEWKDSKDESKFTMEEGSKLELPDPVRPGFIFKGWETDGDITDKTLTVGTQNVTVTANWEVKVNKLTVDPNGGIWESSSYPLTFQMGYMSQKNINVPTRTGYKFVQWNLVGGGSSMQSYTVRSAFTMGYEDATLTAQWRANTIKVTFEPNGGTVTPATKDVVYDSPYGTLPTPEKVGYNFVGWSSDQEGINFVEEDTIVKNPENHTLYAQYTIKHTEVQGKVVWVDENNRYNTRPSEVAIDILADGKFQTYSDTNISEGSVIYSVADGWTFFTENVQSFFNGKEVTYSIRVHDGIVPSTNIRYAYTSEIKKESDGSFTITNTMYEATKDIDGTITWIDKSNAYGSRPDSVLVELYQDGKKVDSKSVTGTSDEWTYSFEGWLISRTDSTEYEYTVNVNPNPTLSENSDDKYDTTIDGYHITEKLGNNNKKVVNGTITWVDDNNKYNYRPENVTIELWNGTTKVDTIHVSSNSDTFKFEELPKYDKDLNVIDYRVVEIVNDYYEIEITKVEIKNENGVIEDYKFDIVNTFNPEEDEIIVKPSAIASINIRVDYSDANLPYLGINEESLFFTAKLAEMKKNFIATEEAGQFDVTFGTEETGMQIGTILTNEYANITGIEQGKYKIYFDNDPRFIVSGITGSNMNNIELVKEGNDYYLVFDLEAKEFGGYIDIKLTSYRTGYFTKASMQNFFQ